MYSYSTILLGKEDRPRKQPSQMKSMDLKVDRWRKSSQKQRWAAAALLEIEPRLRRVKGITTYRN